MTRVCPGWTKPPHPEKVLGVVEPLSADVKTHGICVECRNALNAELKERQKMRLSVRLTSGRTIAGTYDRLGAALRLRFARHLPDFRGYVLEAI